MLFGNILSDLLGEACLWSILIIWAIGWGISKLLKSEQVRDGVRIGFWAWFFSDD